MPELRLKPLYFCSLLDEKSFFEWARSIDCVTKVELVGATTILTVDNPTVEDARELVSLFLRYNVDFKHFKPILTDENRDLFLNEAAGWDSEELDPNMPM